MSRLGRVPLGAGRDVVDRKACFQSFLAQAAVLASIRGPAFHLETFGQSNGEVRRPSPNESRTASPRQEPLSRNGPPTFTLYHRASGPFRAPFAVPSQWIQGREVEMAVQCQNRANCAGVYHCQNRTYDEQMPRSNGGIDS